ncbi:MAG: antibiotic biosynthesis monooxygenase [Ignavibacterium sp.]|nr:antibiotic biosynthesis monooxygenase [Ignavibacterium sp.]
MGKGNIKTLLCYLMLTLLTSAYAQQKSESVNNENNNLTVLVKYKSQPEKQAEVLTALNALILEVKKEPHFVNIKMFVDPADKTNILLYEEWSDEVYYKGDHMSTTHLQKFIGDSRNFLAGPPEISFWMLNSNYTVD